MIDADYPSLLTNLLHYPAPSSAYPFEPFLILAQALFLRSDTSPAAGVEIVIQNQDLLDVKAAPKNQEMDVNGPRSHNSRFADGRGNGRTISGTVKERLQKGGMGGLAQGLFERAQAAGLDKAFISTVNDFRVNPFLTVIDKVAGTDSTLEKFARLHNCILIPSQPSILPISLPWTTYIKSLFSHS